jgi:hypothetical protein
VKKRILLGAVVAAILSVLFAGTTLAQVPNVVYPRGNSDPRACTITEWKVRPDGSVQYSLDTAPNGFSAAVIQVGKHGEPVLTTFDNEDKYNAYLIADGQQPLPSLKSSNANQLQPLSVGNAHCGCNVKVRQNGTNYLVIEDQAYSNFSWSGSLVTYYQPWQWNNVLTHFSWMIQNGPNYTPPSIPSANALGTYNTSYVKPDGTYCWITHRNRAQPDYPSSSINGSIIPVGYYINIVASNEPGWLQ